MAAESPRIDRLRSPVGQVRPASMTTWLIVLNIVIYLLSKTFYLPIGMPRTINWISLFTFWGQFSVDMALDRLQLWRFISFQFLHGNDLHILMNMLALYFFGPLIEAELGRTRFLIFYLLSGVGGALLFTILVVAKVISATALVGASAGIFGILVAAAQVAPDETVLIYGTIPAKLRRVALIMLGLAAITVLTRGSNAGGEAAHLGGAAVGYYIFAQRAPRSADHSTTQ